MPHSGWRHWHRTAMPDWMLCQAATVTSRSVLRRLWMFWMHWWPQLGHLIIQTARTLLAKSRLHWQQDEKKEARKKEALAKPHGRSDGERQPEYASFTMIDSEKSISVKTALDVRLGKFAHISDSFLCGQYGLPLSCWRRYGGPPCFATCATAMKLMKS